MILSKTILDNMTTVERFKYLVRGCDPEKLQKFKKFARNNPHVLTKLEEMAEEDYEAGWRIGSVWRWMQTIRYAPGTTIDTESEYKLSNDYFAYYARLLVARHTEYSNWIVMKLFKGQREGMFEK